MPELPEVETIVRKLRQAVVGRVIAEVKIFNPKTFVGDEAAVLEQKIVAVGRRAKMIEIKFSDSLYLLTHLKMTGQYLFKEGGSLVAGGHPTADWKEQLPGRHTRVEITFADGAKLFFNDMRKFGWLKLVSDAQRATIYDKLGPDVIDEELNLLYLKEKLSARKMTIKQAIMHNDILCGVGNIYACDSLNDARISPLRSAKSLDESEITRLLASMKKIIGVAIQNGGTTFDGMYVDIDGKSGSYSGVILTYGREDKNCYNCENPIKKITLGGRGTYYCPVCQK